MAYIAFEIPRLYTQALTGRDDADLHVTIAHLGKINYQQSLQIVSWLRRVTKTMPAVLVFRATDLSVFGTPEEPVVVRKLAHVLNGLAGSPPLDLHEYRRGLVDTLETMGITVSKQFEWTPHVTVGVDIGSLRAVAPAMSLQVTRIGLYGAPVFDRFSWSLGL